ncbi:hypothetical protein FOC4_g10014857 [Fusarium odoratissimum]|uniref:Uncharacterized protein n=2 Tax=Fusarium oxysporum species complex TaxID=171631 RepID=N1R7B0_FUSC4|nr:hypothetical protein FOC4_g10014857 [Fusarium odoratissimum]ENH61137.1 hypothetical protein FOC1_g10015944 [Fusarium oxysporum f. sp. cubense race 1]
MFDQVRIFNSLKQDTPHVKNHMGVGLNHGGSVSKVEVHWPMSRNSRMTLDRWLGRR